MGRLAMAALVEEGGTHSVRSLPEPQAPVVNTRASEVSVEGGLQASATVALGNTHQMRGFPVMTPEEFKQEAHAAPAEAANPLERKVHLLASLLKSSRQAFNQIVATLSVEGRVSTPKEMETLLALADVDKLSPPVEAAFAEDHHPADEQYVDMEDEEECPLDELPMGILYHPQRMVASAAVKHMVESDGIRDFGVKDQISAGSIGEEAYELLKEHMLSGLTDHQKQQMAQVQPVCKLLNSRLAEGMALVAVGGLLMLYKAILMDTGANCNLIPIRTVRRLGLTIFEAETGARVASEV
ncbi:hypothetical protein CYMTET_40584 [Cymbomonas tetramitiformis]|uniref:Uncharacterized protein n=1 Tax=Cymbomonas tetramitiformis TaxID=36881 RepID=A0AAE0CA00_9CHLO|nr:hypothetical protein CYMTET_40584 [Cymbomonas tetramitiformis]